MGSRVGSTVGAVMDTKNKVRDSASSLKENVKDLPTQAGYAVHSAKQKAKDNISDFKRGVVEERENRQEQRTQKRNLHRENISQKKQELQKAQEARQIAYHVRSEIMAKDPIKKADNGTYYFRANLGYNPITGKQIQKYRSGFRTKKEAKEEYSKLVLASTEELTPKKDGVSFQQFIEETYPCSKLAVETCKRF